MMMNSDTASVAQSSVAPSVTPSIKRQFGDYEERFQTIDSEIDAIRTSFDLDPSSSQEKLDLSVLEIRIDELENAENKLMSERHRLHKMLLLEKEKLIQMREEERLKKLAEEKQTTTPATSATTISTTTPTTIPLEILSPSQKRASEFRTSMGGGGLFEISKQLQISQAKNEAQEIEINRLERQLRLLADLQGVNVADLRRTLEQACADEAFGELQHRIAKLQAELEAAKLQNNSKGPTPLLPRMNSSSGLEDDEEIENLKEELDASKFQIQQQQMEIHRLKSIMEERNQKMQEMESTHRKSVQSLDSGVAAMTKEYEEVLGMVALKEEELAAMKVALEKERSKSLQHERQLMANNEKIRQKELLDQKEQHFHQVLALEKKIIRTENSCALKLKDMEQQLASLYAAVGVINEDHNMDKEDRNRLSNDLLDADSKVASQLHDAQERNSFSGGGGSGGGGEGGGGGLYSTLLMNELMAMKAEAASMPPPIPPAAAAASSLDNTGLEVFAVTGTLLIKSTGLVRKWKPKQARLFLCGDHYQLDIGENKSYAIHFGISKVDFNPNHPLSFVIQPEPDNLHAPIIAAAATNEDDYHKWMSALGRATTGDG